MPRWNINKSTSLYTAKTIKEQKMKKYTINSPLRRFILSVCAVALCACSSETGESEQPDTPPTPPDPAAKWPIRISSVQETLGSDDAFEEGDKIGVYVVNRNSDGSQVALKTEGNYIDNRMYVLRSTWTSAVPEYWKDATTHADFYMYYPYTTTIANVEALPWSVRTNQSAASDYKASELLIGKTLDAAPSENAVSISAKHAMAQVVITLAAGKGFSTASLASAQVSVRINNVRTHATANLATGIVTATEDKGYVTPMREGSVYKAIVVPQQLDKGHLITVTVDGTDFNLQKDPRLTAFEQGHRYQMTVTLSKTSGGMSVGIVNWSDDGVDYGGVAEPN